MSESTEVQSPLELEVVPPGALEAITKGEIDVQIATAKRYPRSLERFKRGALAIVTLDEETAASCLYARPVGKERDQKTGRLVEKYAKGMSIRMAEIVGSQFGNLRVGAMVIEQTPEYVKARGFAHDLETNFACSTEVIESTLKQDGTPYTARHRVTIAKACVAKARRDATFTVVPKALAKFLETEARRVAVGDAKTLTDRRSRIIEWVGKLGIPMERVYAALGVAGESELGLDQLETLTGIKTAIKDGEVQVDEAFPPITTPNFKAPPAGTPPADPAPSNAFAAAAAERKPAPAAAPASTPVPSESTSAPKATQPAHEPSEDQSDDWGAEPLAPATARPALPEPLTTIQRRQEAAGLKPTAIADWAMQALVVKTWTPLDRMTPDQLATIAARLDEAITELSAKLGGASK